MEKKLNDSQRKLVEDHHHLISMLLESRNLSDNDDEDWYGIAALALCEAAVERKNGSPDGFSEEAIKAMEEAIEKEVNRPRLDTYDVISDRDILMRSQFMYDDYLESVYLSDAVRLALAELDSEDQTIVTTIMRENITAAEAAVLLGVAVDTATLVYEEFVRLVCDYYNN